MKDETVVKAWLDFEGTLKDFLEKVRDRCGKKVRKPKKGKKPKKKPRSVGT